MIRLIKQMNCVHYLKPEIFLASRNAGLCYTSAVQLVSGPVALHNAQTRRNITSTGKVHLPLPHNVEHLVKLKEFQALVSNRPPQIAEGNNARGRGMVKMKYTRFRSMAEIIIPQIPDGEKWQVGYIQAVEHNVIEDRYSEAGTVKIVIPELESGDYPMVCDTLGKNYPWYKTDQSLRVLCGPQAPQTISVSMLDVPSSVNYTSSRDILEGFESTSQKVCRVLKLHSLFGRRGTFLPTKIDEQPLDLLTRNLRFITWLVMRCAQTGDHHILRSMEWNVDLLLEYDSSKPQGQRITSLKGEAIQKPPRVFRENHRAIPACVFGPPSANDAFLELWSPKNMELPQKLLRPPAWKPNYQIP